MSATGMAQPQPLRPIPIMKTFFCANAKVCWDSAYRKGNLVSVLIFREVGMPGAGLYIASQIQLSAEVFRRFTWRKNGNSECFRHCRIPIFLCTFTMGDKPKSKPDRVHAPCPKGSVRYIETLVSLSFCPEIMRSSCSNFPPVMLITPFHSCSSSGGTILVNNLIAYLAGLAFAFF